MEQTEKPKDEKPKGEKHGKAVIRPLHIITVIVALAIVIGLVYTVAGRAPAPVVAAGDNISVYYTGTFINGTVFGTNVGSQPLNFTVGANQIISGFDSAVVGMELNQTKNITLLPSQAYGEINQSLIIQVPRSQFGNQTMVIGRQVQSGTGSRGIIEAFNATAVTIDFNPPLAGKTLVFQIKIVAIRK